MRRIRRSTSKAADPWLWFVVASVSLWWFLGSVILHGVHGLLCDDRAWWNWMAKRRGGVRVLLEHAGDVQAVEGCER